MVDSANIWLNGLTASECLLGGRVEFRSDENTTTDLEDGKLHDVHFVGGCPGNTLALSKLLEDTDAARAVKLLKGNPCGDRGTSCANQLAIAVEQALKQGA